MKFDVYGKYSLEVIRTARGWEVYRTGDGKHVRAHDIVIPQDVAAQDVAEYLDDLLHEISPPGGKIVQLGAPGSRG